MRILYFYQYFTTPKGSWSTRCYEFARRWVAAGDQVTVVTSVYDKSDLAPRGLIWRTEIDGIDVRVINLRLSNKHGVLVRLFTFVSYALVATWYALTLTTDVIVASSGPITVGIPALAGRYIRGRRFVFEVRDVWPEGAVQLGLLKGRVAIVLARWFERRCYRAASVVVALSDGMAEWIRAVEPATDVEVVPNASNLEQFSRVDVEGPLERTPSLVVYTGTLGRMDDCNQIVRAAEVLQQRGRLDIQIELLGDGKERPMLSELACELGLTKINFRGLVPKAEVAQWLHRATLALVTFRNVPVLSTVSPNKLFDAFAAGVPVVQTTSGWIKRLLEEEEVGLSANPDDAEALASAIERLVDDPQLRDKMARNARLLAESRFNCDLLASQMHRAIKRASGMAGSGQPRSL